MSSEREIHKTFAAGVCLKDRMARSVKRLLAGSLLLSHVFSVGSDISNGSNRISVSGLAWDAAKLSRWLSHELAGSPVDINSPLAAESAP
jgi:hypothetical protein